MSAPIASVSSSRDQWSAHATRRRRARIGRRVTLYAGLVAGGLAMMIPFLWMVSTSLKARSEVF